MPNTRSSTGRATQTAKLEAPTVGEQNSASTKSAVEAGSRGKPKKKQFHELFSYHELGYYGTAAAVYIVLGILVQDIVLNWIVGPLFIVVWMWWIPPLIDKWGAR